MLDGAKNLDEEDAALERDEGFWKMIHERRKEKLVPFAAVKKRLGLDRPSRGKHDQTKKR